MGILTHSNLNFGLLTTTYVPCQAIQGFADGAGDGDAFVVMREWGKQEQATLGAGTKTFSTGLLHRVQAIIQEDDKGQTFIKGCTGNLLLAGADGC